MVAYSKKTSKNRKYNLTSEKKKKNKNQQIKAREKYKTLLVSGALNESPYFRLSKSITEISMKNGKIQNENKC